ncbi:ROK family protein [Rhizobium sp. TH2]|uniref:ROK family protein n=1 Tax=Rhizobium sp. TH2 TaxID=2775403 RepID=UPI0021587652|nr:ROK family protein [Rhizobium sp. TH2]UVC09459.1 ROK family protein [Rhizobium sp. TH2]
MTVQTTKKLNIDRWATTQEIRQQPAVWRSFGPRLEPIAAEIAAWLALRQHEEVWFCGAGTSAFIGETLASHLNRRPGPARFRAIPTTDLVASPKSYIRPGVRALVVSFGRSGNSSETIGVLDLLAAHAPQYDRLHITCNGDSALGRAKPEGEGELRTIVLPPETDDRGFAMTSSYTTMLLSALACFDQPAEGVGALFARLADAAETIIAREFERLETVSAPGRAVFLGSGPLTGAARECALKVLELAAGQVPTSWDSSLGFRHGPKAIVDDSTRVFVFLSSDPHTRRYDEDLAAEIATQFGAVVLTRIGEASTGPDIAVPAVAGDAWDAVLYVITGQMLAVAWSDGLGIEVDNPFSAGNLTRVVAGVKLYPLETERKLYGGIDLGGSKIESCLFDADLNLLEKRRIETARSYDGLLDCLAAEAEWLAQRAGGPLSLGIGLPGLIDKRSGKSLTSNLAATGHPLSADLAARLGRPTPVENDCKCFALSEANGGAGAGYRTVFGLILGTGVGGGVCVDGRLQTGLNGLPGEVGHIGIPAALLERQALPLLRCGCGRTGCYETLVSGPGMTRIAEAVGERKVEPEAIAAGALAQDPVLARVFDVWLSLLAELIHTVQLTIDADCVVLGGGLSRIAGIAGQLEQAFTEVRLPVVRSPRFTVARFGDASGVRGAAMLASGMEIG